MLITDRCPFSYL